MASFLLGFGTQLIYVCVSRDAGEGKASGGAYTHAGGVVYKLKDGNVHYLLVRPKDNKDEWVLPKGHIERGEGHGEAALREVREETGVVARLVCPAASVEFKTPKENVRAKFYLMECTYEGDAKETREKKWVMADSALQLLSFPENQHALRESERKRVAIAVSQPTK